MFPISFTDHTLRPCSFDKAESTRTFTRDPVEKKTHIIRATWRFKRSGPEKMLQKKSQTCLWVSLTYLFKNNRKLSDGLWKEGLARICSTLKLNTLGEENTNFIQIQFSNKRAKHKRKLVCRTKNKFLWNNNTAIQSLKLYYSQVWNSISNSLTLIRQASNYQSILPLDY